MLRERGIRRGSHLRQQRRFILGSDATMPPGPRPRSQGTGLTLLDTPAFDGADPNTEEAGHLGLGESGVDGSQQPLAEVGGIRLHPEIVAQAQLFCYPL